MNKKVIVVFLLYFFQCIASSCISCDCEPVKTYEILYNGFELKAWDTSGSQKKEIRGGVNKNAFGLTIALEFDLNQIAFYKPKLDLSSFGFASAYATSCDCPLDEYITKDPIESIIITVTNTQSQEVTDVTANFYTYDFNGDQITIS